MKFPDLTFFHNSIEQWVTALVVLLALNLFFILAKRWLVNRLNAEKLKKVPQMVREIVGNTAQARFDRAHFKEFGDFSLNFEVVYYVLSPEYAVYMDIQQSINLALFEAFEKEGLEFAFPTQTLHIASTPSKNIASDPA